MLNSCSQSKGMLLSLASEPGFFDVSILRRFKNIEALCSHLAGPVLAEFNIKAEKEDLLAEPIMIKVVKRVAGFSI